MDLKEIISVSGKSGLFRIVSQPKTGFIVESLLDHKRMPVYASDKVSNLAEISVYTEDKEVPLEDIFKAIFEKESGGKTIDPKADEKKMKDYFGTVLPTYDRQRVYVSDIKKILAWYNILHDNQLLVFTEKAAEDSDKVEETPGGTESEDKAENVPPGEDNVKE
jgi:hypothetical protein